ncbi:hypothetical protein LTX14_001481 [Clostridium perfringens]|uniref:hypothetical protein n=1 Tax=Clostridium perfringens TaxID=1502 RepID=UPI001094218A|nr:hypothetical protein [Clostridium perfringens]EGT0012811.1 hypothetical protein [Clostridium perfringens]EJT6171095.1 hypothetical protein [Clostridium perfringens]EJT6541821.1 hypothetical protein [Clostridium perfringens]EJT6566828.1 hypothetical protein [Clostridium perfringens]ELC8424778.1 hypothetical protein [Clostridium perfringens]
MTGIKETGKILLIYFISTIAYWLGIIMTSEIKGFTTDSELRKYWIAVLMFSFVFLLLIRLLKVRFETVVIFLVIIMFLLLFLILNKEFFASYLGSTPDELKFPIMSFIAIYTTIPFEGIIWTLVGFNVVKIADVIVPLYVAVLGTLSYFIINLKKRM